MRTTRPWPGTKDRFIYLTDSSGTLLWLSSPIEGIMMLSRGQVMSKMVVFPENYVTIETTLYLATLNGQDPPITIVIPANHNPLEFFQVINEGVFHNTVNLIYFEDYSATRTISN